MDTCLPSFFRNKISIKTASSKNNYNLANCTILPVDNIAEGEKNEDEIVLNYSDNFSDKVSDIKIVPIFEKLLLSETNEEKEEIGKIICNSKKILKENIIPPEIYKKIVHRYEISVQNGFSQLISQLKNTIQSE